MKFQKNNAKKYSKWLTSTPKITTIRVNTLKSSQNELRRDLENVLGKYPLKPSISTLSEFPELLIIGNLKDVDKNYSCTEDANLKEIIVDVNCGAAILRGAHIYVPGVLAMHSNTQKNELVNVYADSSGTCRKGFSHIFESDQKQFLGIGQVEMQRYLIYGNKCCRNGIAIKMIKTISGVPSIGDDFIKLGDGLLQNFPSIVCGKVLNPQQIDLVLDMCAAPGNKTTHLAQLMSNHGQIIALEKSERRTEILRKNLNNFNVQNTIAFTFDATKCVRTEKDASKDCSNGPPFNSEIFDKILLDAPCSGVGNRPQLSNTLSIKMAESYPRIQRKLLREAFKLLKPGGILVYSTCSVFIAENEENVVWFLQEFSDHIQLVEAEPHFGGSGWPIDGLTETQQKCLQRFGPKNDTNDIDLFNDTVGFFIAKFKKL